MIRTKHTIVWLIALSGLYLLFLNDAYCHHSIAAGFDMDSETLLTATIKEMDFINPHARMFVERRNENNTDIWTIWFSSANNLFRRGWRADDLPIGAMITVSGFPARDGSKELYGGETKLPDGRTLFGGNRPGER